MSTATVTRYDAAEVLLIRRADDGRWDLPGGIVELGEQPPETAARETREETGVIARIGRCTVVYTNVVRGIVAFVFRATVVHGEPRPTEEAVSTGWFTPPRALELLPPVFATRLRDALEREETQPGLRAHDGARWMAPPAQASRANASESSSR